MAEITGGARIKNTLRSDIAMVSFLLTAVGAAYTIGGVLGLVLIVIEVAILAAFVSLAKGPDVLIFYTVFALFFTAISFVAAGVAGLVIALLVTTFLASRGIVNLMLDRKTIATLAAMIAAVSAAYVFLPGYYPIAAIGSTSLVLLGLLMWSGRISPFTLKLILTRPSEGFQVLRMKVRATWERATYVPVTEPHEGAAEVEEGTAGVEARVGGEAVSKEVIDEGRNVMVTRYLNFLSSLELAYKDGRVKKEVYERLRSEYVTRLKELGYDTTKIEEQG
ncbi:MAG: hypothetical protein QXO17_06100 [Nitrososphaerota archaeon]